MDIGSKHAYPANALSNFAPHPFVFDEVECNSMEGLLQSFKFKNPEMQKEVCKLVGFAAKSKGKMKNWLRDGIWWQGKKYDRFAPEYQELIDMAYDALSQNEGFQRALIASGDSVLTHSMGKRKDSDTILTVREFCSRLTKIRERLLKDKNK